MQSLKAKNADNAVDITAGYRQQPLTYHSSHGIPVTAAAAAAAAAAASA